MSRWNKFQHCFKKSFIAHFSTQVANILIECSVTFTKSDGKTLPDTSKTVGPSNNALHSLFSSVRLSINDQLVTLNNSQFYAYKAYFSNLLTYGTDSKLSHLIPQGWATGTFTLNVQMTNVISWNVRMIKQNDKNSVKRYVMMLTKCYFAKRPFGRI